MEWSDLRRPVTDRTARQFAGLWLLFFGGLAVWLGLYRGNLTGALAVGAVALGIGSAGLIAPKLIRPVYRVATLLTFPIGWVVSRVMLATIFFGVFTPVAMVFRLIRRDALKRSFDPELQSYWEPKRAVTPDRYFRQY